uniref:Uncharacterized protein n=1 Tax=Plectus sambesii TaxID=2011161 RepID=A0A914WG04_9BILA
MPGWMATIGSIISEAQASSVCDNMWIGADDIAQNGVFTWTDCTPFSFTHWKPGQPVLNSNKLCVAAEARASGYWNTNDCGDEFCFICENNSNCSSTQTTTTIAPPTLPPAAQCYAMDIIFVVDMSQSPNGDTVKRRYKELVQQLGNEISARTVLLDDPQLIDDFQNEKNMLKNITDTFPNGHYGPPVGVQFAEVSFYDRNTAITFYLNSANSQSGYDALIDSMLPYTGDTFIEVGLTAVRDYMLNAIRGYRSNVPTIVMLFSDGNDNPASHPIPIAEQLIQHGVSIFALYNDALDSSPNIALLQQITQDNSRVVPLDQYYTLRQPFYDIINNFIKTTGFDPCHPPVYADIVFVMDHSENQVRAGEVGFATPVDYVMYQKAQIKSIIHQLGVSTRGHRYVLVHFSDSNSYQVPGATHYTNKTGILFDTTVSFTETTMDSYIDNFPELDAGGATDLKLALDVISSAVVPQIASQNDPNRLTYMVIFTSGFYDTETNCCQDPLQSALAVQSQFKANTIIPVMSGKLADRNPTAFLEYTGYSNQLPQYDVNQTLTADSIVQTIKKAISAQEAANSAGKKI